MVNVHNRVSGITARCVVALLVSGFTAISLSISIPAAAAPTGQGPSEQQSIVRGLAFLRSIQEKDGSWGEYPATTALAVSAFLRNGKNELNDNAVYRGVHFLVQSAKPNGAIYDDRDPAKALPNYNTAIVLMTLAQTHNVAYRDLIVKAQRYLEGSQLDETEGLTPASPAYGGIGYGTHPDRPDLSNLQMALRSLSESGVPSDAPVFKKAILFLQRVQNRTESNDQAWVKSGPNDGGFSYDSAGSTKVVGQGEHASMGALTYAGLESYIYCGVTKTDPRAKAAWDWIRGHYTVTEHPGMGDTSLYYYYHTMSKTLAVYGSKVLTDKSGKQHNWAEDLSTQIVRQQHPDGSWSNTNSRYWENDPALVTSYSLISLSYCNVR